MESLEIAEARTNNEEAKARLLTLLDRFHHFKEIAISKNTRARIADILGKDIYKLWPQDIIKLIRTTVETKFLRYEIMMELIRIFDPKTTFSTDRNKQKPVKIAKPPEMPEPTEKKEPPERIGIAEKSLIFESIRTAIGRLHTLDKKLTACRAVSFQLRIEKPIETVHDFLRYLHTNVDNFTITDWYNAKNALRKVIVKKEHVSRKINKNASKGDMNSWKPYNKPPRERTLSTTIMELDDTSSLFLDNSKRNFLVHRELGFEPCQIITSFKEDILDKVHQRLGPLTENEKYVLLHQFHPKAITKVQEHDISSSEAF